MADFRKDFSSFGPMEMFIIEPVFAAVCDGLMSLPVGLLGSSLPALSMVKLDLEERFGFEPFACGEYPVVGILNLKILI